MVELLLVDLGGNVLRRYVCERLFGRIQHDGRWFRGPLMRETPMPEHVYIEEEPRGCIEEEPCG